MLLKSYKRFKPLWGPSARIIDYTIGSNRFLWLNQYKLANSNTDLAPKGFELRPFELIKVVGVSVPVQVT